MGLSSDEKRENDIEFSRINMKDTMTYENDVFAVKKEYLEMPLEELYKKKEQLRKEFEAKQVVKRVAKKNKNNIVFNF